MRRFAAYAVGIAAIGALAAWGVHRSPQPPDAPGTPPGSPLEARRREARELLAAAGAEGAQLQLWTFDAERPYMPDPRRLAILLKSQIEKVGLAIEIVDHDLATHLERVQQGEHELALLGWTGDTGDPDNFLYVLLDANNAREGSASNIAFYRDEEVHRLLLAAQVAPTRPERADLYREAQRRIEADAPIVPLVHSTQSAAFRAGVTGAALHPTGILRFARVAPPRGDTLVFARGHDSIKLDPADVTDGESVLAIANVCEGLVRHRDGSTDVEPCLASSWEVDEAGTTWTFRLRDGVRFHDGTPMDAAAVLFSFRRQMDPEHPHAPEEAICWRDNFADVQTVEAVDAGTVRFVLARPFTPFLTNLAMYSAAIVSPAAFDRPGTDFARSPVGTGPFRFGSWEPDERITLEAFADHWEGPPAAGRLILRVIPDNATRLQALLDGSVHGMKGINPQDLPAVRANADLSLLEEPGMNVAYLACNTLRPPLTDPRVRRAIALAVDRETICASIYRGSAIPARAVLPPTIWGHPGDEAQTPP